MFALITTARYRPIDERRIGLTPAQMGRLGNLSIALIHERASRGVGSDDQPMKPLNAFYARRKTRGGQPAARNLRSAGPGPHMLDEISVRRAQQNSVRVDIPTRLGRIKAAANEKRAAWYGWSPRDASVILTEAQRMARGNIREVTAEQGLSIWMDPRRRRSVGYQRAF
jgi:hypothetical protein